MIGITTIIAKPNNELSFAAFNLASVALGAAGGSTFGRDSVRADHVDNVELNQ